MHPDSIRPNFINTITAEIIAFQQDYRIIVASTQSAKLLWLPYFASYIVETDTNAEHFLKLEHAVAYYQNRA